MSKSLAIRAARILQALKDKNRDSLEISELAALDLAIESLAPEDELLPAGEYDHETGAVWHDWRQASAVTDEMVERANSMRESDEVIVCTDDVHALVVHPSTARKPATPAPATAEEWPARSLVMLALYKLLGVPGTESVREDLQRAYDLMGADRDAEFKTYAKARATAIRVASEMQAWAEKKMTGNGSSRIDRTVLREWAEQLLGDA